MWGNLPKKSSLFEKADFLSTCAYNRGPFFLNVCLFLVDNLCDFEIFFCFVGPNYRVFLTHFTSKFPVVGGGGD